MCFSGKIFDKNLSRLLYWLGTSYNRDNDDFSCCKVWLFVQLFLFLN